jgi:predicted O-linked N-acetylglucosamine transferase (SPINDLY family)
MRTADAAFSQAADHHRRGDLAGAAAAYRRAMALVPAHWAVHFSLGNVLYDQRRLDEAVAAYREAVRLKPDHVQAYHNLGAVLVAQGHFGAAVAALDDAVRLNPEYASAHLHMGNALKAQGRLDVALAAYRTALRLQPAFAEASLGLGNALQANGDLPGAIAAYSDAIRVKPSLAEAHNNLAAALQQQGRPKEALDSYLDACRLRPGDGNAAAQALHLAQELCLWDDLARQTSALRQAIVTAAPLAEGIPPFSMVAAETSAAEQQLCARRWALSKRHARARPSAFVWPDRAASARRLRIGYLSSDFHEHPTSLLMAGVFEASRRREFEIVAYSLGSVGDGPMHRRLQSAFTRFVDLGTLSDEAAAHRIHEDGIDILVDLKGLTAHARPGILAYRPAPLQAQFLGYPGTMGTPLVDYVLADRVVIPAASAHFYDEHVVYLPHCYQPNDPARAIGTPPSRAGAGLPDTGFVFCSFNHPYKITPTMFDAWMRILRAVPDSVLWLLAPNRWAPDNLRREAVARGVSAGRLIFASNQPQTAHLARLTLADLVLDTRPVNSHTTASDALWAGVPILTCPGEAFVSRVAASLLAAMDLPELIASGLDDYERRAIDLARRREILTALADKVKARRRTSPVFDAVRFARHLEAAYRAMWERYVKGEPAAPIAIAAEP